MHKHDEHWQSLVQPSDADPPRTCTASACIGSLHRHKGSHSTVSTHCLGARAGVVDCVSGSGSVELRRYPLDHPFAQLQGSDNIIAFTTQRYKSQPLIVRCAQPRAFPGICKAWGRVCRMSKALPAYSGGCPVAAQPWMEIVPACMRGVRGAVRVAARTGARKSWDITEPVVPVPAGGLGLVPR